MTRSYTLLPRAQKEIIDAWIWYEERQPGLGEKFKSCLYHRIHQIIENPKLYSQRRKPYRETRIKPFPYLIIYFVRNDEVIISSVFHTGRNIRRKYTKIK